MSYPDWQNPRPPQIDGLIKCRYCCKEWMPSRENCICGRTLHPQWCVYLLECRDGSLYCGMTNDIHHRVDEHNRGNGAKYTKPRLPVVLKWRQVVKSKSEALRLEYDIKCLTKAQKLKLIEENPWHE